MFNEQEDRLDAKEMKKAIKELGDSRVVVHKLTLAPEINEPSFSMAFLILANDSPCALIPSSVQIE